MAYVSSSPPRAPPIQYDAPVGTRWAKETAAAGGVGAFDLPTDPKFIGPWILGECVGKGASGRVKIAKHRVTGKLAAVKILPLAPLVSSRASLETRQIKTDKQRLGIDREITMMKLMNHPNILRIYDVYEGAKELFLVLEYVEGGELFDFLVNRGRLTPEEAREYFKQIVYGLNYAHTFSIIHRDLKPENILIASLSPPLIKIADWGMAAFAPPSLQLETSCGSPHYASPEIVNGERYQGNATDIWSCGVILYALLTGRLPFDDKNVKVLLAKVKSGKFEMPPWIDPLAMDLLSRMLVVDVSRRITIPEIMSHPWLLSTSSKSIADKSRRIPNPPLPPSPSTLARPLDHPSLIDPDLFSSLRIIWGRHADPQGESIKRDLCAPAGRGLHAKAFYFLLGCYRDDYLRVRDGGTVPASKHADGTAVNAIDGMESIGFNLGWELDLSGNTMAKQNDQRLLTVPNSRAAAASVPPPISGLAPPLMSRTPTAASSRERPASPAGPRAHSRKPQQQQPNIAAPPGLAPPMREVSSGRPVSSVGTSGGPRPLPRRGYTYSGGEDGSNIRVPPRHTRSLLQGPRPDNTAASAAVAPPQFLRQPPAPRSRSRSRTVTPSIPALPRPPTEVPQPALSSAPPEEPIIHAPIAIAPSLPAPIVDIGPQLGSAEHDLGDGVGIDHEELPLLTAPRTSNAELQKTMDAVAERLNGLVRARAASSPAPPSLPLDRRRSTKRTVSRPAREDKENQSVAEEGWSYVAVDEYSGGVGLGVDGVNAKIGKEMGNVVFLPGHAGDLKAKKDRERKGKHTTLPALKPKRSTISLLASPITLTTTTNHHGATTTEAPCHRFPLNVACGCWKGNHHPSPGTGVIYSPDGLEKTRREVGLLLERLGIVVEGSGFSSFHEVDEDITVAMALRCKVEEASTDGAQMVLKPVRFRIEFSAAPSSRVLTYAPAPPSHKHHSAPLSPNPNTNNLPSASLGAQLAAPLDPPLKNRASVLMNRTASSSAAFPPGCQVAIVLMHEKGSASTFKNVWKRLKETYANGASAGYPTLSPAMRATPFMEQPQRFAL
ncbi:Protein kinase domain-containing protein [Mycena venus]|uniref:Protein kinase domain-containing protein n=1 Tax=Mycena venus TaxID=2733690 RepID=A0A8H7D5T1_9AGAR|nr:Protein kinase domain-containing protein [Mycena venus]